MSKHRNAPSSEKLDIAIVDKNWDWCIKWKNHEKFMKFTWQDRYLSEGYRLAILDTNNKIKNILKP